MKSIFVFIPALAFVACDDMAGLASETLIETGEETSPSNSSGGSETGVGEPENSAPSASPLDLLASSDSGSVQAGSASMTSTVWTSGKGKIALAYASSSTCYLSEVHGGFKVDSDSVRVWTEAGYWYAEGKGNPSMFTVNCFRKEFATRDTSQGVDGIVSWTRDGDPVGLGLVKKTENGYLKKRTCFLTEVKGPLQNIADSVNLLQVNGGWLLSGTKGGSSPGPLRSSAVCVTWTGGSAPWPAGSELKWVQGQPKKEFPDQTLAEYPCALARISGDFDGVSEWVGVWREGQSMFMGGGSASSGVAGSGRCLEEILVNQSL